MISLKQIKEIYKLEWAIVEHLSQQQLKEIRNNINENMPQYISDEIRDYLENK